MVIVRIGTDIPDMLFSIFPNVFVVEFMVDLRCSGGLLFTQNVSSFHEFEIVEIVLVVSI